MAARRTGRGRGESALAALDRFGRGELPAVVLLHGDDSFLRDRFLDLIRSQVLGEGPADFNHDRFEWPEAGASAVVAAAQTLPFMSPRRLVEVHRFEKPAEKDAEALLSLLEHPPETAVVVFCAPQADMRLALFRRMAGLGGAVLLQAPDEGELPRWLAAQARSLGFELRPDAAALLVDLVEPSLGRLHAELEKLASYVGEGGEAGVEEIGQLVGRSKMETVFRLGDAIAGGDAAQALTMLHRLLESEAPQMVLGFLRTQVRRWTAAKAALRQGKRGGELAAAAGVPPFAARRLEQQVGRVSSSFLRGLYGRLLAADRRIKRTSEPRRIRQALELFAMEALRERGGFGGRRGQTKRPGRVGTP